MAGQRAEVVLAANQHVLDEFDRPSMERLESIATVRHGGFDLPSSWDAAPPADPDSCERLIELIGDATALVVGHGAPRVDAAILDARPGIRFVGELEGDRFARRIDVEAAWERGVRAVDTTNGTSYGVAEWALTLALIGLRGGGGLFRRMVVDREEGFSSEFIESRGYRSGELSGASVGLVGCGIIGRRLLDLLEPFGCEVFVHDPYVPRELADAYDVTFTSLDQVMALGEVVFCVAPLTPATRGLLDAGAFGLMRDEAVFVNVGRGAVVQSDALLAELQRGRIHACLDVFDPEPIPADAPIRDLPNAFLTPHIAGETAASRRRLYSIMVDELSRFFAGHETRFDLSPATIANRRGLPSPDHG